MKKQKHRQKLMIEYYKDKDGELDKLFRKYDKVLQRLWAEMCKD